MTVPNNHSNSTGPSSAAWIATSFMAELLANGEESQVAQILTQQMRELTGARTVILMHHEHNEACRVLYVCPSRRNGLFTPEEAARLCPVATPETLPVRVCDFPSGHPLRTLLETKKIETVLLVPLHANGKLKGSVVLLDLPKPERVDDLRPVMNFLDPFLGIVLQNALAQQKIREQNQTLEGQVSARTAELNEAKQAALNMMEDAVLAKEQLEVTQHALDHSADAVFWVERDCSFSYVNNSACRLLGYTREEFLKLSVLTIDNNFSVERMEDIFAELERMRTLDTESELIAKDGRVIPVEIHDSLIQFGDRTFICAFIHDITDRKKAEEQVHSSEENLRTTLNSIGDAVIATDTGGCITTMNPVAEALTGWNQADALGRPLEEVFRIINEASGKTVENPVTAVLASGKIVGLANHTLLIAKDGTETPITDSGAPIKNKAGKNTGVVLVFRDQTQERTARKALEKSETRYRLLFENMAVGFALHEMIYDKVGTPVDYRFLQINPAFEKLTGLSAEKVLGRTVKELMPDIEPYWIETYGNVAKTGNPVEFENYSKELGRTFDTRAFSPVSDQFAVVFSDITERKRMQEAIEKRILALTRPLDNAEAIAFDDLFDLKEIQRIQDEFAAATGVTSALFRPDGTEITEVSKLTYLCRHVILTTATGCANCVKSDKFLWNSFSSKGPVVIRCQSAGLWDACVSIVVGDRHIANWMIGQVRDENHTEEQALQYAREIGADEQVFLEAFRQLPVMSGDHFKKVSQALFTLASQLSTSAYLNLQQARFISEEKRHTENLKCLLTAIEQSPETIVITNAAGIIEYVNPAFETITGYSRDEAIGKNPRILKGGQHDAAFYSNLWKTISSGDLWFGRFINKRKDGILYTEEVSIAPVRGNDGAVTGYVAVKRDITEELSREELFRQSQKMEAIGQLAGGIAHDFNNLLQAILGFSEILIDRLNKGSLEHRNTVEIQKAAKRAAELTRQLLTFSRKQPVNKKMINLNSAVHDAEVLLNMLLGENIQCKLDLATNLQPVHADAGQLSQIVMNLAVNARDAMPEGGRLSIATDNVSFEEQVTATLADAMPGDFVCLSVTDTGTGMSQEVREHLFEPFFTTKSVGKGTGLGLAVVYGIVKQSKGWIHVYSEIGKGTTFKIYLPASTPRIDSAPALSDPERTARILVIDDDDDTRNLVLRLLNRAGYKTVAASSAEEAQELFDQDPAGFDLLFSDIVLPGRNGIELANIVRQKCQNLPVLLTSGYRDPRERWTEINSKGYTFLQKPFSITGLLATVHELLSAYNR